MKKSILSSLFVVCISVSLGAQVLFEKPLSPRNANYDIEVTLDVEEKQIHGHEVLTWRNITRKPTRELQFHLYMNAFKNTLSSHLKENNGNSGNLARKRAWGWIDINSLKFAGGQDLTNQLKFIHPDDDN